MSQDISNLFFTLPQNNIYTCSIRQKTKKKQKTNKSKKNEINPDMHPS